MGRIFIGKRFVFSRCVLYTTHMWNETDKTCWYHTQKKRMVFVLYFKIERHWKWKYEFDFLQILETCDLSCMKSLLFYYLNWTSWYRSIKLKYHYTQLHTYVDDDIHTQRELIFFFMHIEMMMLLLLSVSCYSCENVHEDAWQFFCKSKKDTISFRLLKLNSRHLWEHFKS